MENRVLGSFIRIKAITVYFGILPKVNVLIRVIFKLALGYKYLFGFNFALIYRLIRLLNRLNKY